jgi:multiple sugar transport system permease protein
MATRVHDTAQPAAVERPTRMTSHQRRYLRETLIAYLFLLPAGAIIFTFHLLPVIYAFYISMHKWVLVQGAFLGLSNFSKVFHDPSFYQSLAVTIYYVIGTVPLTIIFSIFIAYLLFQKIRGLSFFRTVFFLPYIVSSVAAGAVFTWIFNPRFGPVNMVLDAIGIGGQKWMLEPSGLFELIAKYFGVTLPSWAAGPSLALCAIMVFAIWQVMGFDIVIFMAGLGSIPNELYEAARIDGASGWQLFRRITIPMLSPTTFFVMIISIIGSFQAFNHIYVMTTASAGQVGGPLGTTTTLTIYMFRQFWDRQNMGYGSSLAFVLFGIILVLTILQNRILETRVTYS